MRGLRVSFATLMTIGLTVAPAWAGPKTASSLGTIVTAEKARVGDSAAEVGTTIYSGEPPGYRPPQAACRFAPGRPACCFKTPAWPQWTNPKARPPRN